MSDLVRDPERAPIRAGGRAEGNRPAVGVYAAAASLATVVPVPLLDRMLGQLARGAAMRRVAAHHGVRLAGQARKILSRPDSLRSRASVPRSIARKVALQLVAPLRIAARIDDAVETLGATLLLDHYLATSDRRARSPLSEDEARRVRAAMDRAFSAGPLRSLRDAPGGAWRAVVDAAKAAGRSDAEDRSPAERLVDALLDAAADAPSEVGDDLRQAFDEALRATRAAT